MFLGCLNQKQKELFINLALHAAFANGVLEDEEITLIESYCKEMSIDKPEMKTKSDLEEVLLEIKSISTITELNKIVFEILAIFISDKEYSEEEVIFIEELAKIFGIKKMKIDKMIDQIEKYNLLIEEIMENLLD